MSRTRSRGDPVVAVWHRDPESGRRAERCRAGHSRAARSLGETIYLRRLRDTPYAPPADQAEGRPLIVLATPSVGDQCPRRHQRVEVHRTTRPVACHDPRRHPRLIDDAPLDVAITEAGEGVQSPLLHEGVIVEGQIEVEVPAVRLPMRASTPIRQPPRMRRSRHRVPRAPRRHPPRSWQLSRAYRSSVVRRCGRRRVGSL
jgi:hypothetical protein